MGEPSPPRNRDQDIPTTSGEEIGEREPLGPQPGSEPEEQRPPLSEEETHDQGREEQRPDEENSAHRSARSRPYADAVVESNHDEERLARIEQMIEALQRESAALKIVTAKLLVAVAVLSPATRLAERKT